MDVLTTIWEFLNQDDIRGNNTPPSGEDVRITEDGKTRITENVDTRILE